MRPRLATGASSPPGILSIASREADLATRLLDLGPARARPPEGDVAADRAVEEEALLRHHDDVPAQRRRLHAAQVLTVDPDRARRGVVEAADQLGERRLPGAARADHRDPLAGRDHEVEIGDGRRRVGGVAERDAVDLDAAVPPDEDRGVGRVDERGPAGQEGERAAERRARGLEE